MAWEKSQIISKMITSFFNNETTSMEEKQSFLYQLTNINGLKNTSSGKREDGAGKRVLETLTEYLEGFDRYTRHQLKHSYWSTWLTKVQHGEGGGGGGGDAELLTNTLNICGGHIDFREEIFSHNEYTTLSTLTTKICQRLSIILTEKEVEIDQGSIKNKELEEEMQELVKLVIGKSGINRNIKKTFLAVVKTYYYTAYFAVETIDTHVFKVLFEPVN